MCPVWVHADRRCQIGMLAGNLRVHCQQIKNISKTGKVGFGLRSAPSRCAILPNRGQIIPGRRAQGNRAAHFP